MHEHVAVTPMNDPQSIYHEMNKESISCSSSWIRPKRRVKISTSHIHVSPKVLESCLENEEGKKPKT